MNQLIGAIRDTRLTPGEVPLNIGDLKAVDRQTLPREWGMLELLSHTQTGPYLWET